MRSSRMAQDTSRIVSATAPRRSLRSRAPADGGAVKEEEARSLSATPTRKRKRDSDASAATSAAAVQGKEAPEAKRSTRARPARRQPAKRVKDEDGNVAFAPPPNWEEVYRLTQEMRRRVLAPVDTMGCENLAAESASPRDQRYQTLTALMLSSQTKDAVTAAAIRNLQEHLPGGLNVEAVLDVDADVLNGLIGKVGFHNLKTKYLKSTAEILRDRYNADIPDTIDGLVSLPGVGPKMAYLCMSGAWGRTEGIGVDVHVHRITNLWGWHKTNQPEETRLALQAWLPKDKWHEINHLLVGFGQTICAPVGRKCGDCMLAEKRLCPAAVVAKGATAATKRAKIEVEIESGLEPVETQTVRAVDGEVMRVLHKVDVEVKAEEVDDTHGLVLDIEDVGRPCAPKTAREPAL